MTFSAVSELLMGAVILLIGIVIGAGGVIVVMKTTHSQRTRAEVSASIEQNKKVPPAKTEESSKKYQRVIPIRKALQKIGSGELRVKGVGGE